MRRIKPRGAEPRNLFGEEKKLTASDGFPPEHISEIAVLVSMPRIPTSLLFAPFFFAVIAGAHAESAPGRAPNVVFILADDLGYGDVSCYGQGKIRTPNIDRIATAGVRMTSGYAPASTCTPTRYGIMTGEYAWRKSGTGILPGDAPLIISPSRLTLPRIFKDAGYATAAFGKWHLGLGDGHPDFNGHITPGLNEIGFDYSFNMAATGDRVPCVYMENGRVVNLDPKDPIRVNYRKPFDDGPITLTQLRKKRASRAPDAPVPADEPVMRMDSNSGHADTIVNGIGRIGFMAGGRAALWEDHTLSDTFNDHALKFIRDNKAKPFFIYYAAHEPHVPRDPNPRFVGKSGVGARGDAVLQLDDQVGKILDTLKAEGLENDTIVIFSSDNGPAVADGYAEGALKTETKTGHYANGVLRGGKYTDYEGGVRLPFLVSWPGHVKAGTVNDEPVSLIDLAGIAAGITGRKLPADAAPDSFDIMPVFTAGAKSHGLLFGNPGRGPGKASAIRDGDWKLIVYPTAGGNHVPPNATPDPKGVPKLFDLTKDIREEHNLAAEHPDIVARLTAALHKAEADGFTRPGAAKVEIR